MTGRRIAVLAYVGAVITVLSGCSGISSEKAIEQTASVKSSGMTKAQEKEPVFEDGMAQPVFEYSDLRAADYTNEGSDILRFCVYVETDHDTDSDGKADLAEALVQLLRSAAWGGFKAATIYDPTLCGDSLVV